MKLDEISILQLSQMLEAGITQKVRTTKRTPHFRVYLDILNSLYIQQTAISDTLKALDRLVADGHNTNG